MNQKLQAGFTFVEITIALGIIIVLMSVVLTVFTSFRNNESLKSDTDLVVQVLRDARNKTLASKSYTTYGVHFSTPIITIFPGTTYDSNNPSNENISLNSNKTSLTLNLNGGGSDVIFQRLTGETVQNGSITISLSGMSQTKTVTIYKTGVVESQ